MAFLAVGLVLAVLAAAGCARQPASSRASVQTCIDFGVAAIKHHVTVTSLPPACQGLTKAQVDFAVGSALHSAAIGARGKAAQRKRIAAVSHFLEQMVTAVPRPRGSSNLSTPAGRQFSRTALGVLTLIALLITVALGLSMMARWILRPRGRRAPAGRFRRPPALNFAHLGLGVASLLVWTPYLATGVIALAWTGCVLLALETGLGMAVVFIPFSAVTAGRPPAQAVLAPEAANPPRRRRAPAATAGAHIMLATVTLLLAILTAVGVG